MTKRSREDAQLERILETWQSRAPFVVPQAKKVKYIDGIPNISPGDKLRSIIHQIMESYKYKPLKKDEDIRVLVLEIGGRASPGRAADPIVCRLSPSALPTTPGQQRQHEVPILSYEALSYYWGRDAEPTMTILVKDADGTRKKFQVRPNLYAALIELRSTTKEVKLWVDAICIHQNDIEEKTFQVSRMHEIYSKAKSTCIWFGVGDLQKITKEVDHASTARTFEFIRDTLTKLDELVEDPKYAKDWYSFVELMRNRWFSRRWVVQELAFAKEATVHWGQEVMQWRDFADAVALFVEKHDQIDALLKRSIEDLEPIGDMKALGANILVEANSSLFRRSNGGEITGRLKTLEVLVSTLLAFEATEPKDILYAVLSIASDIPYHDVKTTGPISNLPTRDRRITPDYSKEEAEIFGDFIDYCIETSGSLDIICRHWAPAPKGRRRNTSTADLDDYRSSPTWVSVITGSAFGGPEVLLAGRCNGDSLVGTTSRQNQHNYSASGDLKPCYRVVKIPQSLSDEGKPLGGVTPPIGQVEGLTGSQPKPQREGIKLQGPQMVLYVKGIRLDVIMKLSPRVAEGNLLQECLEMGGWTPNKWDDDERPAKVPEALWRTLVADRGPHGSNTENWYSRACLDCFAHISQNGVLNTMALIDKPKTASSIMIKFLKRVQEVVWNRKFLLSQGGVGREEEKRLFGLAPTAAQEGDIIVILFGCSVPVLLREAGTPDDRYYRFVGEIYVHGMMDGEALPKEKVPVYPYEDFTEFKLH